MFERFTEKAVNVVSKSQEIARECGFNVILPEHLLLALVCEAKGVSLRIFKNKNITYENLLEKFYPDLDGSKADNRTLHFGDEYKELLKRAVDFANVSGNSTVLFEHLFLAVLSYKEFQKIKFLNDYGLNIDETRTLLQKLVQKKIKRILHPETDETKEEDKSDDTDAIFDSEESAKVFERAVAKLSTSNYEILGTEQILSSILEDKSTNLYSILENFGITSEGFDTKLKNVQSRSSEYAGRQIIFTPNAFKTMNLALQTAKELGSSVVLPEHIILGILKAKKGVAYDIIKEFRISDDDLAHAIIKPIEKQMPETLTILRLAKEEARRIGRNTVGTEMFLLGIIAEPTGIGSKVLKELEINIKEARDVVENIVGFGNEYYDREITFTARAKRVLETAWHIAKKENKTKIESSHMLLAITTEPTSLAMKALEQLGVDSVEIREGVKKFSNAQK
ncbi:MAG: hypothetical protein NC390_07035 [Fusobacterium sp.]|nr:hypothetical protein [Fusobacterium sp.]